MATMHGLQTLRRLLPLTVLMTSNALAAEVICAPRQSGPDGGTSTHLPYAQASHCQRIGECSSGARFICDNGTFFSDEGRTWNGAARNLHLTLPEHDRWNNAAVANRALTPNQVLRGQGGNLPAVRRLLMTDRERQRQDGRLRIGSSADSHSRLVDNLPPPPPPPPPHSSRNAHCINNPRFTPTTEGQNQSFEQMRCLSFYEGNATTNPHFIPPSDRAPGGSNLGVNSTDVNAAVSRYAPPMGPVNLARDSASCFTQYASGAIHELGDTLRGFLDGAVNLGEVCSSRGASLERRVVNSFVPVAMCTGPLERMLRNNYGSVSRGVEMVLIESARCAGSLHAGPLDRFVFGQRSSEICEQSAIYQELKGRFSRAFAAAVNEMERDVEGFACLSPQAKARQICSGMGRVAVEVASFLVGADEIRAAGSAIASAARGTRAGEATAQLLARMHVPGAASALRTESEAARIGGRAGAESAAVGNAARDTATAREGANIAHFEPSPITPSPTTPAAAVPTPPPTPPSTAASPTARRASAEAHAAEERVIADRRAAETMQDARESAARAQAAADRNALINGHDPAQWQQQSQRDLATSAAERHAKQVERNMARTAEDEARDSARRALPSPAPSATAPPLPAEPAPFQAFRPRDTLPAPPSQPTPRMRATRVEGNREFLRVTTEDVRAGAQDASQDTYDTLRESEATQKAQLQNRIRARRGEVEIVRQNQQIFVREASGALRRPTDEERRALDRQ